MSDATPDAAPATGDTAPNDKLAGLRVVIVLGKLLLLGGAERQALLLGRMLKEHAGADVRVVALYGGPGRTSEVCDSLKLPWRALELRPLSLDNPLQQRRLFKEVAALLRRERPDVLLPYTTYPNVVCGNVWRDTGAKLTVWSQRAEGVERVTRRLEQAAVANIPWFIANSHASAAFLRDGLGAPAKRIRIIHNGVEVAEPLATPSRWREELEVGNDCLLACMIAHLSVYKDHVTLLHAWRRVVDALAVQGREAVLLLAGRHVDTGYALKALAFDLDLGRSVRFLGEVEDVSGLLGAADLCVFSSRSEGSPNGVLESMAAGLAVAGTDIPALREAVGDEGLPYLASAGDAAGLASRIVVLMTDDKLRLQLGAHNRERIHSEFSPRRLLDDTTDLLTEALDVSGTRWA